MSQWLRQLNSALVLIGPFMDEDDGKTEEELLNIVQADIRLSKNGDAAAQSTSAAGGTHDADGYYCIGLTMTDTDTLGRLRLYVHKAGALPVWQDFMVAPASVYDALFGSEKLPVDVVELAGSSDAADKQAAAADTMSLGTVDDTGFTPTVTEFESDDITVPNADHHNWQEVRFQTGNLADAAFTISNYSLVGGRGHFTVARMPEAPADDDTFIIV